MPNIRQHSYLSAFLRKLSPRNQIPVNTVKKCWLTKLAKFFLDSKILLMCLVNVAILHGNPICPPWEVTCVWDCFKGGIISYEDGGGRLFVTSHRHFSLVPPFDHGKKTGSPLKNWSGSPIWQNEKILVPPFLWPHEKILVPPFETVKGTRWNWQQELIKLVLVLVRMCCSFDWVI